MTSYQEGLEYEIDSTCLGGDGMVNGRSVIVS